VKEEGLRVHKKYHFPASKIQVLPDSLYVCFLRDLHQFPHKKGYSILLNKERTMKKMMTAVLVLLFAGGIVYAKDYMVMKQSGDYVVHVMIDKNPPVAGENQIQVSIQDKSGADVTDATVEVDYSMPAMMGMPAMNYKAATEMKDKKYNATLKFSMSGAWNIAVKITREGKTQSLKFNVDVS
jgi:hypothetical protein